MAGNSDVSADDESTSTSEVVRALTTAGWLALVAWLQFLFRQVARAQQVGEQAFAGQWEQRIEVLSFLVLPPNGAYLVPAALLACSATFLSGPMQSLGMAIQIRIVRWAAILQCALAGVSIVSILINETGSPTENQDIALRLGGLFMSAAIIVVTRAFERSAPGWSRD